MNVLHQPFQTRAELTMAAADLLADAISASAPTPRAVMLSGGETPLPVYEDVARRGLQVADGVRVFFSDERMVSPEDSRSNYGRARFMFQRLGLDEPDRALRVPTHLPLEEAADAYHEALAALVVPPNRISLGVLGLGDDGHTASLFSQDDVRRGETRLAIAVPKTSGPDRVSVSSRLLSHIERIVFLVVGPGKASVVAKLLADPTQVVAGIAVERCKTIELWSAEVRD